MLGRMREQLRIVGTVLRDPTLARIELAYLGFNMAEFATWIAILVYAYDLGGAGAAAVVAVIQLIPAALVAPFAATIGDRFRRDRVLLAGYLIQAAAFGSTALAMYGDAPAAVTIAFATAAAAAVTLTRPVQSVITPILTHSPADLTAANAVAGLAETLGIFTGPLLGGLLLARSEPGDVFLAFAGVSVVAATLVARLPAIPAPPGQGAPGGVGHVLRESFGGFGVLRREPEALLLVTILATMVIVLGGLELLFVAIAIDLLALGESWAGFLYAAFGLGGVVGAVAAVALIGRRRMTPALAANAALYGLPIVAIGVIPTPLSAPLLFGVAGAGYSVASVAGRTLLQRTAPEALLARIFGILEGLTMFAYAVGSGIVGILIGVAGVAGAIVVVGIVVPVLVALAWLRLARIDRDARPLDFRALALLRALPIFAPLSAPTIERILGELEWLDLPAGAVVIREGEPGDRFYVIADGQVEVSVRGAVVNTAGPGGHVGEIALLRDVPRTATVTALTPLHLIAIERGRFLEAVTGHPESRASAESVVSDRLQTGRA